jgi:hypothetical protein
MPISLKKLGNDTILEITGNFSASLEARDFPMAEIKRGKCASVFIDATFTDASAAIQTHRLLHRIGIPLATIKRAAGLAILVAAAADAVIVSDGGTIEFGNLPADPSDALRSVILAKLSARLGETPDQMAAYFTQQRKLKDAEASAFFARPHGLNAKALIDRNGKIDPAKVYSRWNSPHIQKR